MQFSYERFKNEIFHAGTPPQKTAVSLAIGVWLAFSPFPGLHLLIAFLLTRLLKLNGVVLLVGVMVHNPWTMLPIHMLGLTVGDVVLTGHMQSLDQFQQFPIGELGIRTIFNRAFWHENGPMLAHFIKPFLVGHLIMNSLLSLFCFRYTLYMLKKHRPNPEKNQ